MPMQKQTNKKTQTWISQESICLPEKNRTKFIQLGLTGDSKKKWQYFYLRI